jgi:hypothetical protein
MRRFITLCMVLGGLAVMVVSYFFLSAPWGTDAVKYSNPRMQFAPLLFVVGIVLIFSAALFYEVKSDRRRE